MSAPVNLNKARKARDRMKKRAQANENAVKFGRTKAQKALESAREKKRLAELDQHRQDID